MRIVENRFSFKTSVRKVKLIWIRHFLPFMVETIYIKIFRVKTVKNIENKFWCENWGSKFNVKSILNAYEVEAIAMSHQDIILYAC